VGARLGALLPDWDPDVAERRRGPADVAIGERFYAPLVRHVVGEDGVSITVSLRDVTETRGRETRRLDFYSMVAHDLRTPLSAMLMRVDWLLAGHRGTLQPEVRSDIVKVEARIRELVALLNDFLELARMESMGISVAPAPQDLNDLARETVEEYLPLARASSLDLQLELCPEDACADVDPRRIAQVLGNLVSNAVKFTPRGGRIVVRVSATAERVRVEVVDTGCGIAREDLPSIFGRYERGTQVAKDVGGTGLGLMIVREIVEAHGGWVTVESAVGRGSTFAFELRRVPDCGAALPQSTA
jgi:two-component system phosphate regulon sensor histidine kinase PhoR